MPHELTSLRVEEISSVDSGAGKGVNVMLIKRHMGGGMADDGNYISGVHKREFTAEERREAAGSGAALPDGSFPIHDKADLHNAMQALGRAKDPAKVKAHIRSRARALGLTGELSDAFKSRGMFAKVLGLIGIAKGAKDFDAAQADAETQEYADGMMAEFREAICSLQDAVCSTLNDPEVSDKDAALKSIFAQFVEHIGGVVPEGVEQAMTAAGLTAAGYELSPQGTLTKRDTPMTEDEKKAMAEEKDKREKAEKRFAAVLKMSDKHKAFMNHEDATMPSGGKEAFADMEPGERDEHMAKNPIEAEEGETEKRLKAIEKKFDAEIAKRDDEIRKLRDENAVSKSAVELVEFKKRAAGMGLPEGFGETLQKAYGGDKDAIGKMEQAIKALNEQGNTAALFKNFGTTNGANGSASGDVAAKVAEMQKANPNLSERAARVKLFEKSEHSDLRKRYDAEMRGERAA